MRTSFIRFALGAGVALSLLGAASFAQASQLTQQQISAIIGLLQSFGADQATINQVSVTLGGSSDDTASCSNFSNLKYGDFDNAPGGRVSQMQLFLGIPSNTFGFGTYGRKTQAAWNARCGNSNPPALKAMADPAVITEGARTTLRWSSVGQSSCHLSSSAGTKEIGLTGELPNIQLYTHDLPLSITCNDANGGSTSAPINLTIRGSNSQTSAAIDQSSLNSTTGNPTITGSAAGTTGVVLTFVDTSGAAYGYGVNRIASVVNGRWSLYAALGLPNGTYTVTVFPDESAGVTNAGKMLTTGMLTVNANNPSATATIDPGSLTAAINTTNSVTIFGTATNVSSVQISLPNAEPSVSVPVINGRWTDNFPPQLPAGSYQIEIFDGNNHLLTTGTIVIHPAVMGTITLTSPNTAGQQLVIGSTFPITWRASNMPSNASLAFYLVGTDGKTYMIPQSGYTAVPSQGIYNWTLGGGLCIPDTNYPGQLTCVGALNPGQYQLVVKAFTTTDQHNQPSGLVGQATSPWFTIVGNSTASPQTISSSSGMSSATAPACTITATAAPSPSTYVPGSLYVLPNTAITLAWTTQNANSTTNNFGGAKEPTAASKTTTISTSDMTYSVTASNTAGNTATCSVTVHVDLKG